MTLEEKVKIIEEGKEKNYLFISPRIIKPGAKLVENYETLNLYEEMEENTKKFAENVIVDLISNAKYTGEEVKRYLSFYLIFCGGLNDLPDDMGNMIDFLKQNKDRVVAVCRGLENTEERNFFVGFLQSETVNNYYYFYLNLAKLFEEFDKNNIKYDIDFKIDRTINALYRDDSVTRFVVSLSPKKELKDGRSLKRRKK